MGHEIRGVPEAPPLTGGANPLPEGNAGSRETSIGAYLARQRRMRGISVGELAELTKIPTRSIERMEAGAFDGNPDGFVRGFVRTIAAGLGLDPEEAVMRMLGEPADLAEAAGGSALSRGGGWGLGAPARSSTAWHRRLAGGDSRTRTGDLGMGFPLSVRSGRRRHPEGRLSPRCRARPGR